VSETFSGNHIVRLSMPSRTCGPSTKVSSMVFALEPSARWRDVDICAYIDVRCSLSGRRQFRGIGADRRRLQGVSAPLSRGFEDAGTRTSWDDSIWRLYVPVGMMSFSKTGMGGKIHEPEREDVPKEEPGNQGKRLLG
jgi:hypothetical protein